MFKFAFEATTHSRRNVTVREIQDRFESNCSVDVIESGSLNSAIRVFNQRHRIMAFGQSKPKFTIVD